MEVESIVHDLRNIFCIVVGNLELLRHNADPSSAKIIARALTGAERGDAVIARLTQLNNQPSECL